MFSFAFIKDSVFKKLGLHLPASPTLERNEASGVAPRTADEGKHHLNKRDDVTREQHEAGVCALACDSHDWGDMCNGTSGVETPATRHTTGVTSHTLSATHDPTTSTGGGHHTIVGPPGSIATHEASVTPGETRAPASAVNPPASTPTTLQLLPPSATKTRAITPSSGSSSPEMFFDATDSLSRASSPHAPDTDTGDDEDCHHKSFRTTQDDYKEGSGMTQDPYVYKPNEKRNQETTSKGNPVAINDDSSVCCHGSLRKRQHSGERLMADQPTVGHQEDDILRNVLCTSSEVYESGTAGRLAQQDTTQVVQDRDGGDSGVISDTKHRKLEQKNVVSVRYTREERESKISEQQISRYMTPNPELKSQESDCLHTKATCDHRTQTESQDVRATSRVQCEGSESHSSAVPDALPLDTCLGEGHDGDLFDESRGSEFLPQPLSQSSHTVTPSHCVTRDQMPNSAAVSNFRASQAGESGDSHVPKHEPTQEDECKQSPHSSLDPRAMCHGDANKPNKLHTCGARLLGEVFPAEKPSGSNLREETKKIVMMLSNDRACRVPRPSLGLQDRLRTLSQRTAGRRTTYVKGPRFCSTTVKNIVKNTHDRLLQSRRDSFQEFIQSRRDQAVQRVFANPDPCYGSATATSNRSPSPRNVTVGEKKIVHDDGDAKQRRQEGADSTSRSTATVASVSHVTKVMPPVCPPLADANEDLIHGGEPSCTKENARTRPLNVNIAMLGKNIVNNDAAADAKDMFGFGAKLPTNTTSDTDNTSINDVVQMVGETGDPGAPDVFQGNSDDARPAVVLWGQNMTDCNTRQHGASSCPATQPTQTEVTTAPDSPDVTPLPDTLEYNAEHVSKTTTRDEELDMITGTSAPSDCHVNSTRTPSRATYSSAGTKAHEMEATTTPPSDETKETFTKPKTKPYISQRPRENSSNAVDLRAHIAALNKVSPKLINRMVEVRKSGDHEREAGGCVAAVVQEPRLASTTSLQTSSQEGQVVSASPAAPGVTQVWQSSSSEASKNARMTICNLDLDSTDKVQETRNQENLTETKGTNNLDGDPSGNFMFPSSDTCEASGTDQTHSNDGAGNMLIQEDAHEADDVKTSPSEANTACIATSPHGDTSEEVQRTQLKSSRPHHTWSCLEDITKLKTDNLVARCRGIRPLLHSISPPQHLKYQPSPTSASPQELKQPVPISPHPQPSSGGTTATATHDKRQTSIDDQKKYSADGRPPLPVNTRQHSVDECPLSNSRQGSVDSSLHINSPQDNVDECPNIRQDSIEECSTLAPDSRRGSVAESQCVGQKNHPRSRLNSPRDSSGGRLSFYAERKRSRANSHHPRSRHNSIECVRPSNRRDTRSIHQSCYSKERRDSNNVCLYSCAGRGSRVSFGQDLLRKCLEAAVGKCERTDWEETREEEEQTAATLSQEDLNKSLSKAVCQLDAEKTRTLLKLGADPNVRCGQLPALLRAAKEGALYVVQALLAAGADVDVRSDTGNSSLHVAARAGFSEVAIQLVYSGAHVDAINRSGVTPLQMALARGHMEVARTLLRHHADMFLPNKVGETAFEVANHLGYMGLSESPREVRRASAPGTWVEPSPTEIPVAVRMIQGIEDGCPATVEACLAEGASPNTVVPLALHWPAYATVLHRAAHYGHDLIVQLLLASGAHINRQDVVGNTPLHAAAQSGHNRIVKILLQAGALLEAKSQSGMTPLHRAASKGKEFTCNLLLRRGCDPQAQDNAGLTPADWARKRGFKPLAKKLVYRRKSSASLLADSHRTHYLQHLNQLHEAALKAAEQEVDVMDCPE
ncbi:LOW QUALITY PROTEIN: uncharacterized protein [Panulirus ornatus]|uniref:LOW QUALITY PROTEIN: uncharacterized protein n=1 Tax=Panulirus ornatus TaxID=150431 RepID=UPI003A894F36